MQKKARQPRGEGREAAARKRCTGTFGGRGNSPLCYVFAALLEAAW